jgi:hypothetical protein
MEISQEEFDEEEPEPGDSSEKSFQEQDDIDLKVKYGKKAKNNILLMKDKSSEQFFEKSQDNLINIEDKKKFISKSPDKRFGKV